MTIPPFSPDFANFLKQSFVYLCETNTAGRYDLFVAVPVEAGYKVIYTDGNNIQIEQPTVHLFGNFVVAGFEVKEAYPDTPPARVITFVFRNFQPPQTKPKRTKPITAPRIKVGGMQYLDFDDADIYTGINGDVALNCPYLFFQGLIIESSNTAQLKVIVPVKDMTIDPNLQQSMQTNSAGTDFNRLGKVLLSKANASTAISWESADHIVSYFIPQNDDGGFEVQIRDDGQILNLDAPGFRKTKVKNKNKTLSGGGNNPSGGGGWHILDFFRKIFKLRV